MNISELLNIMQHINLIVQKEGPVLKYRYAINGKWKDTYIKSKQKEQYKKYLSNLFFLKSSWN